MTIAEDHVLVEFEAGSYSLRIITKTPEAGRRKIAAQVREAYPGSLLIEDAKLIENFNVTRLSEFENVEWR